MKAPVIDRNAVHLSMGLYIRTGLGVYPLLRLRPLMVSPLRRVPFSNAGVPAQQKGTKRLCPTTRCLAVARHAVSPALLRGSPRWAIPGPARLNRRPAGLPTAQCLRSAIVVNGAPKSKAKARRPDSRPDFSEYPQSPVGASLLAMDVNDYASCLDERVVWTSIASRLAPTMGSRTYLQSGRLSGRLAVAVALAFDFLATSRGFVPVLRSGLNRHGCRFSRAGPRMAQRGGPCRSEHAREKPESTTGCQAPRVIVDLHREHARSYRPGGVPFFQVTRCKSETIGGRYRNNGYTPKPNTHLEPFNPK